MHVVVASDMPLHTPAVLQGAIEFAGDVRADLLTVLHVVTDERLKALEEERPEEFRFVDVVLDQIREEVTGQAQNLVDAFPCEVEFRALRGGRGSTVVEWVAQHQPDYLVVGVRNRSKVGKLIFGSTTQTILLNSPISVLSVPVPE